MEKFFHYTSISTFFKIIHNKSLWLTSIEKMNDYSEVKYFLENYVQKNSREICNQEGIPYSEENIQQLCSYWSHYFILSLSKNGDSLGQWRGYAHDGTGVAIGFLEPEIIELQEQSYDLDVRDVQYSSDGFTHISPDVRNSLQRYLKGESNLLTYLQATFYNLAITEKHPAFAEEDEVRLIFDAGNVSNLHTYSNPKDKYPIEDIDFLFRENDLLAYHKISIKKEPNIISSVTLGPKCADNVRDIQYFLEAEGFKHVRVKRSEIPYR